MLDPIFLAINHETQALIFEHRFGDHIDLTLTCFRSSEKIRHPEEAISKCLINLLSFEIDC